jgi:hypothetical protein
MRNVARENTCDDKTNNENKTMHCLIRLPFGTPVLYRNEIARA